VLGVQHEPSPRWVRELLRYHPTTRTWSMIEVMLIDLLVVLIKIADYATVVPGVRWELGRRPRSPLAFRAAAS